MFETAVPKKDILNELSERTKGDLTYESGRIIGSMCTSPHEFALDLYAKYAEKNLGDPGLFPGTAKIERDLITELGLFFGGEEITGSMVSGGTEANFIAMSVAKKLGNKIKKPEVICSENAHASFFKAADFMGIKIQTVGLNEDYTPDLNEYESKINENTIGLVGIAGTTSLGIVEPIQKIAKMANDRQMYFHVDAAFGGFVIPFLEDLGRKFEPYDFRVSEVNSITADPHKMGMGVIPTGGYLVREQSIDEKIGFSIPYLAGGDIKHLNITGTRPGGSVIAFWGLMKFLGREGFREIVKDCWENTLYLEKRIQEIKGIESAHRPQMNILGIKTTDGIPSSICKVDENLRKMGWGLGIFKKLNLARLVVMPHIKRNHLEDFCRDLEKVVKKIREEI
jgi:tyrosine decarboxylase/aspartate 1-decarboxylase